MDHRPFALPGTRPQYGPDRHADVLHVDLHLRPDLAARRLDGVCTTRVEAIVDGADALVLDAVDLEVAEIRDADGTTLTFSMREHRLRVRFARALRAGERYEFSIVYAALRPRRGLYFIQPETAYPEKPLQAWTQSQDQDARHWFPCVDHPSERFTFSTSIVVPKGLFAYSNGRLISRTDEGDHTLFRYELDQPLSAYLTSMVAGEFVEHHDRHGEVPVSWYVEPRREADGERSFGKTPKMMEVFERRIGVPYPFARYGQIAVHDFTFGGMENSSATTQTDRTLHDERAHLDFSSDPLVAHELAHQWFGDLLTCRDWSQAWLNESFATFFEAVFREADLGWDEYVHDVYGMVSTYLHEDDERYRRPIVCNLYREPIDLFDRHLYEKGGTVLHMLRGELGEELFWRSINRYVADNGWQSVETIDLVRAVERATGRNIRWFTDQWIERGGHPELTLSYAYDDAQKLAKLRVKQKQKISDDQPPYRFTLEVGVIAERPSAPARDHGTAPLPGEQRLRLHVDEAEHLFVIPVTAEPALLRLDPGNFVLKTVELEAPPEMLIAILLGDPDPASRIRAAKRLAKESTRDAREALRSALLGDPFWGVQAEIAAALGESRSPSALESLIAAVSLAHPKARRAVAAALGSWREARAADALAPLATEDPSYFVMAAALEALGKTRDGRGFELLVRQTAYASWAETVACGAVRGLAETADERAVTQILECTAYGKPEPLRRAAMRAAARAAALLERQRTRILDALMPLADDDRQFLVQLACIAALESVGDARALPVLARLQAGDDPRVKRPAAEAAIKIREASQTPAELVRLREDLDQVKEENRRLRERIEELARR
ncbi:MAG TPA: M1 family metallopeptidase [Candidatus Dormibacteraeota bacterium]|nr:M1 family metallopeptidase [Candidatus Dormibacteraeota bacterium]